MDPDVVCEGYLLKLPHTGLGRTWNRRYFVLWRASHLGSARLEYFADERAYHNHASKKALQLRFCEYVAQVTDKAKPFVFEMKVEQATHRMAANSQEELNTWLDMLQRGVAKAQGVVNDTSTMGTESRFADPGAGFSFVPVGDANADPMQWGSGYAAPPAGQAQSFSSPTSPPLAADDPFAAGAATGIRENMAYESGVADGRFRVHVEPTAASQQFGFSGEYTLIVSSISLQLIGVVTNQVIATWPLRYLRRYGREERTVKFTFEAGRKCQAGPGAFELKTTAYNEIFTRVDGHIKDMERDKKAGNALHQGNLSTPAGRVTQQQQQQPQLISPPTSPGWQQQQQQQQQFHQAQQFQQQQPQSRTLQQPLAPNVPKAPSRGGSLMRPSGPIIDDDEEEYTEARPFQPTRQSRAAPGVPSSALPALPGEDGGGVGVGGGLPPKPQPRGSNQTLPKQLATIDSSEAIDTEEQYDTAAAIAEHGGTLPAPRTAFNDRQRNVAMAAAAVAAGNSRQSASLSTASHQLGEIEVVPVGSHYNQLRRPSADDVGNSAAVVGGGANSITRAAPPPQTRSQPHSRRGSDTAASVTTGNRAPPLPEQPSATTRTSGSAGGVAGQMGAMNLGGNTGSDAGDGYHRSMHPTSTEMTPHTAAGPYSNTLPSDAPRRVKVEHLTLTPGQAGSDPYSRLMQQTSTFGGGGGGAYDNPRETGATPAAPYGNIDAAARQDPNVFVPDPYDNPRTFKEAPSRSNAEPNPFDEFDQQQGDAPLPPRPPKPGPASPSSVAPSNAAMGGMPIVDLDYEGGQDISFTAPQSHAAGTFSATQPTSVSMNPIASLDYINQDGNADIQADYDPVSESQGQREIIDYDDVPGGPPSHFGIEEEEELEEYVEGFQAMPPPNRPRAPYDHVQHRAY